MATSTEQALKTARYSFLARPPSGQKKRPTQTPPSAVAIALPLSAPNPPSPPLRRRASNIAAWAALVQPGSPAPRSPHRRPSTSSSRRPSLTRLGRRPSISHSRAPSGSFSGLISTPISAQDIDVNLSTLGYTSVFVHIPPKTPSTPSHVRAVMKTPVTPAATLIQPPSPKKSRTTRTVKRFRSLGILRPRSKSTSRTAALPSPTKATPMNVRVRAELIAKRKKAKYAHVRPPPPLANEIALMQFAEGGSVESNVRRMMEAQARVAGGELGVADVYRDGNGGLWWDQDEEMEYAHLLDGDAGGQNGESQWVKFRNERNDDGASPKSGLIIDLADPKRESTSTQDSDLDPRYLVLPAEETQFGPEDVVLSFAPASPSTRGSPVVPGLSVLSLPSRPRRAAKHLRKPSFLLDMAAFGPRSPGLPIRISPKSPLFPSSPRTASSPYAARPRTPKSARFSSVFAMPPSGASQRVGGKIRRRPAPLKLSAATANVGWKKIEVSPLPSVAIIAEARREFVEASFVPKPVIHQVGHSFTTTAPSSVSTKSKPTQEAKPQHGKTILVSLRPSGDAGLDLDVTIDKDSGNVMKKKRTGLGCLFGRK